MKIVKKMKINKIKISNTKVKIILDLVNFLTNNTYIELSQKYINYLNIERKIKNNITDDDILSDLHNNFFNLNSLWFNI